MRDLDGRIRRGVGGHFRRLRQTMGWTLEQVVERVERDGGSLSISTLHRIESGRSALPLASVSMVSRTLGISMIQIEELLRTARSRDEVELGDRSAEELLDHARGKAERGHYLQSLSLAEAAHDLAVMIPELPDRLDVIARALLAESYNHRKLRCYALSLEAAGRVLTIEGCAEELKTQALLLHVEVHYMQQDYLKAEVFAEHAGRRLDGAPAKTRAHSNFVCGVLFHKQKQWDRALPLLTAARDAYHQFGRHLDTARLNILIAVAEYNLGREKAALRLLHEALTRSRRLSFFEVENFGLRQLALIDRSEGRYEDAFSNLERAAAVARRSGLANDLFLTWYCKWELARIQGDQTLEKQCARVMKRMLRRIERAGLPEAERFLQFVSERNSAKETT